ncbi:carbamoyltransferase HypF [Desulfurispira natronophila]|uniref:Carbamoyltransferase n=1 Tax=Desulfurispira natronophila TaxID=682562 RepID=A0A7W7Y2Y0_9BACT|nr:carbamoyltransferase HypF [Desulfurispira natronophila]MBB5020964.1 hydrogenase maturation protein HypF [Desulfurispira natronophila]
MTPSLSSWRICVRGTVQGVGFRPFVYRLASKNYLKGVVYNDSSGVVVEFNATSLQAYELLAHIQQYHPPMSIITAATLEKISPVFFSNFTIQHSQRGEHPSVAISPDTGPCQECIDEMHDPNDRRHNYPFINCTNCGPRYSIIHSLPYDRPNTSMEAFTMCPACDSEYHDPLNRRYHAQPISCFDCGPQLVLRSSSHQVVKQNNFAITAAAKCISDGGILAVKGLGGFQLLADATNSDAVEELRRRKHRPAKPLAVMFDTPESLRAVANPTRTELQIIASPARPIVLLPKNDFGAHLLSHNIAPGIHLLGAMLPSTPLHSLLLQKLQRPMIATSANMSDEPIIADGSILYQRLGDVYDLCLDHDRIIINPCDDSVLTLTNQRIIMLRRARGYAPTPIELSEPLPYPSIATGGHHKNTVAIGWENTAILSPHTGDLDSPESQQFYQNNLASLQRIYNFVPQQVTTDGHPRYYPSQWARETQLPLSICQHHHAHLLATMAEYNLQEPLLGVAWDGNGYGSDNTLWGGEVFLVKDGYFHRQYHLPSIALLGGEQAIKEPRRAALAWLLEFIEPEDDILSYFRPSSLPRPFSQQELKMMQSMWRLGINSPSTTSMGRLFDATASLMGLCHKLQFEGQTGLLLEQHFCEECKEFVSLFPDKNGNIPIERLLQHILTPEMPLSVAISCFFNSLAKLILDLARHHNLPVVCSGGVFQNRTLVGLLDKSFQESSHKLYIPQMFPPNDGALSLGQLMNNTRQRI